MERHMEGRMEGRMEGHVGDDAECGHRATVGTAGCAARHARAPRSARRAFEQMDREGKGTDARACNTVRLG